MRKTLSKIHIWLGLLCAPYMIIFGFSSLHFNHDFGFIDAGQYSVSWEREFDTVTDTTDDNALAERVRLALDLDGWIPWWLYERGDNNGFGFQVNRPAKRYMVQVNPSRTHASVEELRQGPLLVLSSLHALGSVPGKPFTKFWSYYTYLSVLFVLFAGGSGVYFWSRSRNEKIIGWILLAGVSGGSLLLMVFVWMWG